MLTVRRIINTPVSSNCFVLYDKKISTNCIIVDPGSKYNEDLLSFLCAQKLKPDYIILTHEHFDHCWGVNNLVERYNIPIICTDSCIKCIANDKKNCSVFYDNSERFSIQSKAISIESINYELCLNGSIIRFFKTPGHTEASMSFLSENCLFTGDALIKGLRTVTKLPTGSQNKQEETVRKFAELQGKGYKVFAGHGEPFLLDNYDLAFAL